MTQPLSLEEKHHYGMCGGGCRVCYEEAAYEDEAREAQRRAQDDQYAAYIAECYAEEEWLAWLGVSA